MIREEERTLDEVTAKFLELPLTDSGNGEAFAMLWGDFAQYDHRRKRWLIWNDTRWQPDTDGQAERLAKRCARKRLAIAAEYGEETDELVRWALSSESEFRRRAMLRAASCELPIADSGENWDCDPWLLGCENCVIDLRSGIARPGTPDDHITMSTGIEYDPNARCDRWERFLAELWQDPNMIDYVWRAAGSSASGDTSEQCLFLDYGTGANGKTVFLSTVRHALGDYAANTPFQTFEQLERGAASNDIAALVGKRFVTASETRESARLNEARIKVLTGGDPITARFLYSEYFTFTFTGKIWLCVNHRPRVSDDSFGFWRRIRLIPFTRTFGPTEADPHLAEALRDEAPGILNWLIRGCLEWQMRGLEPPMAITDATEQYRVESDPLANFLDERCIISENAQVLACDLYKSYMSFCQDYSEKHPMTTTAFGRRLTEKGFAKQRVGERRAIVYRGIGLAASGDRVATG